MENESNVDNSPQQQQRNVLIAQQQVSILEGSIIYMIYYQAETFHAHDFIALVCMLLDCVRDFQNNEVHRIWT